MIFYSHIRMGSSQTALRSASRGLPPPASSSCGCDLQRANRRREMAAGGFCGPLLGVKVYQKVLMFDALTPSGHGFRLPVMRRPGRRRRRRERRDLVLGSSFLFCYCLLVLKKLSVCLSHCLCFFECPHTASDGIHTARPLSDRVPPSSLEACGKPSHRVSSRSDPPSH